MSAPSNQASPLSALAGLAGGIGGFALSRYCGSAAWIPGGAALVFAFLFTKTPIAPKYFRAAIGITAAHATWFAVGSAIIGDWTTAGLDVIALALGIIWLWASPGILGALFLAGVQLLSLWVNVQSLSHLDVGSPDHRALTMHCVFRLLAVVCLVTGYLRMRRERPAYAP